MYIFKSIFKKKILFEIFRPFGNIKSSQSRINNYNL